MATKMKSKAANLAKLQVTHYDEAVSADDVLNGHVEFADLDVSNFRLTKEEIAEAANFTREHAASCVGMYRSIQRLRVGASNKLSAHNRLKDVLPDAALIVQMKSQLHRIEKQAARGLAAFASAQKLGRWAMSNVGVGPVLAAGLLAHIDLVRAQTAGAIWKFAGLDPTVDWNRGERRPYNAELKNICWQIGECFKRMSGRPDCFYGQLYKLRKAQEVERNDAGAFADAAAERLDKAKRKKWNISDNQRKVLGTGRLQAAGLDLRAMRYAVKIFLSHYHQVGRLMMGLGVPKPWALEHGGHAHFIEIPNWPFEEE